MALDATLGGSAANSYCTVAEADAYFSTSFNRTVWTSASVPNKEIALIESSRLLDTMVVWRGYRATVEQSIGWPRSYVYDPDRELGNIAYMDSGLGGPYLSSEVIPRQVKAIVYELAYSVLENSGFNPVENDLTSLKIGSIKIDFSEKVKNQGFPQIVRDMLVKWGEYSVRSSNEMRVVALQRA
jgi:hypothetical protein